MKVGELLKKTEAKLKNAGVSSPRLDTLILMESITGRERSYLQTHEDYQLSKPQQKAFDELLLRRLNREPIAYILGHKEFFGLKFKLNEDVLIPRVETEKIVEHIIDSTPRGGKVLDIGTGSGVIAISIKKNRPDLSVLACDISPAALKVAKANAKKIRMDVEFIESNLFSNVNGKFDAIAANLPYVAQNTKIEPEIDFEPELALYSGEDGLELYGRFFTEVSDYLAANAEIVFECEDDQARHLELPRSMSLKKLSNFVSVAKLRS